MICKNVLPMKTDVIPESLIHQRFAESEEHVEQPGVVDDVDPEPLRFTLIFLRESLTS